MGYYKIKINPADRMFSNYIRKKAGWRCEYCGKLCKIGEDWIGKLEASHYHVRSHWSTRYDPLNVHALCFTCHKTLGEYKREENGPYDLWMKEKLGEEEYQKLKIRANTSGKRDDKLALLYVKQLIKEFESLKENE